MLTFILVTCRWVWGKKREIKAVSTALSQPAEVPVLAGTLRKEL